MAKFKLGLFENRYIDLDAVKDNILQNHQETALEMARKSIVLLRMTAYFTSKARSKRFWSQAQMLIIQSTRLGVDATRRM